ncbi:MAG: hypothetical protein ACM359_17965 [Bacillota bacterium]
MTSHRKASVLARNRNLNRAITPLMERLEDRRLLTVLNGDIPAQSFVQYRFPGAGDNEWGLVRVGPGVIAEVTWLDVDEDTGAIIGLEQDPQPPGTRADGAANVGSYMYGIRVTKANLDSYVMATYQRSDNGNIITEPFEESAGDVRVINNRNGQEMTIAAADGSGRLLLGALEKRGDNSYPVLSQGAVTPGLTVDDGVNLGRFLFGGTVIGQVTIGGSMDLFYAGQLLTGDANGVMDVPDNFHVKGDLQNLVVKTVIGSQTGGDLDNPTYLSRVHINVDGRLGQIRTYDSFVGSVSVLGGTVTSPWTTYQNEVEKRGAGAAGRFLDGYLADGTFFNDTFETAQFVGSINSDQLGDNSVNILGTLNAVDADNNRDWFDYYGVGLYAGQTVQVQLVEYLLDPTGKPIINPQTNKPFTTGSNLTRIGVFDPDGRLIATDYSDVDPYEVAGKPFRFTADRPGVYRFAVATYGDSDFVTHEFAAGTISYGVQLTNVGNVTLGGVVATNNIFDPNAMGVGFDVENGDLGAVYAGGNLMSISRFLSVGDANGNGTLDPAEDTNGNGVLDEGEDKDGDGWLDFAEAPAAMSVFVAKGNLRTLQGGTIGVTANEGARAGLDVHVPNGLLGLVRSTTDRLWLNPNYLYYMFDYGEAYYDQTDVDLVRAHLEAQPHVSGDVQLIDSAGRFYGNVVTKQKLGVLRAGEMATLMPSVIAVNADLTDDTDNDPTTSEDGVIDLIDVVGDLGRIEAGGPHINTGPGGNVRYINVGGQVYSDEAFGGGEPQATLFEPNELAEFYDDSGSKIALQPSGGPLSVTTYGIRGSGGVAIVRVDCAGSLTVTGSATSGAVSAEIGRLNVTGTGVTGTLPFVSISGSTSSVPTQVDVFEITGGDFTNIINNTKGELVNITAGSVTTIQAETIGLARSSTPVAVNSATIRSDAYPFSQQRILVNLSGAAGQILARQALGNISAASIAILKADYDGTHTSTTYDSLMREGIVGPIYTSGELGDVTIGAGIAPAGNGQGARAGLFAEGRITFVRGNNADIRGIVASNTSIGTIQLINGSLINANIRVGTLVDAREISLEGRMSHSGGGTINRPVYEIGLISIEGNGTQTGTTPPNNGGSTPTPGKKKKQKYVWVNVRGRLQRVPAPAPKKTAAATTPAPTTLSGGIIGTLVTAADIGTVKVSNGGFGIFDSLLGTLGNGVVDQVEADGMGLHDVAIWGGAKVNNIIAKGDGKLVKVTSYSPSVRWSENSQTAPFDPFTNFEPNGLSDLYAYFKGHSMLADDLSATNPSKDGLTNTGVNSNMSALAQRELGLLQAWRLEANGMGNYVGSVYEGFSFANKIREIQIANDVSGVVGSGINGVRILTGDLPVFNVGRDVTGLRLTVSGRIGPLNFGRNVDSTTRIFANGNAGIIDSIKIGGDFAGRITAERKIGTIAIKGKWTGKVYDHGVLRKA